MGIRVCLKTLKKTVKDHSLVSLGCHAMQKCDLIPGINFNFSLPCLCL